MAPALADYFHFHGLRAAFLAALDENDSARAAFERALTLARTPAESEHIRRQIASLPQGPGS